MFPKPKEKLLETNRRNAVRTAVKWASCGDLPSAARALVFAGLSKQEAVNLCIYWWRLDQQAKQQDERVGVQMRLFREKMGWS